MQDDGRGRLDEDYEHLWYRCRKRLGGRHRACRPCIANRPFPELHGSSDRIGCSGETGPLEGRMAHLERVALVTDVLFSGWATDAGTVQ